MTDKLQMLRSPTLGNRPGVGAQPYGAPYVNFADKQLGVVDSTQTPQDLIGVPYFSAAANYSAGQPVNYLGNLYIALVSITAGAWTAANWSIVATKQYVDSNTATAGHWWVCDYRVKKDVVGLSGMWDSVKRLRPVKYTHTQAFGLVVPHDDLERWGFIAHELQDALTASAAIGTKDAGTLQGANLLTVVAALTKALQEAMSRIENIEARIA